MAPTLAPSRWMAWGFDAHIRAAPAQFPPVGAIWRVENRWGREWGPRMPVRVDQACMGPGEQALGRPGCRPPATWRLQRGYRLGPTKRPSPTMRRSSRGRLAAKRPILAWLLSPPPSSGSWWGATWGRGNMAARWRERWPCSKVTGQICKFSSKSEYAEGFNATDLNKSASEMNMRKQRRLRVF